jgi:murein L,D-transpeptidase YafK
MKNLLFIIIASLICLKAISRNTIVQKVEKTPVINKLEVFKSKRQLLAFSNGKLIKTYTIALGKNPNGAKHFQNDFKTPEGEYVINDKNAFSQYHKNLGISYPNKNDIVFARKNWKDPGSAIKIHGLPNKLNWAKRGQKLHRFSDWTNGCIALTDDEIDELFKTVKIGSPITIYP